MNFEGRYEVSDAGSVRSLPHTLTKSNGTLHKVRGTVLSPSLSKGGYLRVLIGRKSRRVHQLVAEAFLPPRPRGHTDINHLNGVKVDNRVENLEWATRSRNMSHAVALKGVHWAKGSRRNPDFCKALSVRSSKQFAIKDPDGVVHTGVNLTAFCAENGLPYNTLLKLKNGTRKTADTEWRLVSLPPQSKKPD